MTTQWNHLVNSAHIDWVLQSVKNNPDEWSNARAAWTDDWSAADWSNARGARASANSSAMAVWNASWNDDWAATWSSAIAAGNAGSGNAASDAVLSLVAYDHAAKYLDMTYNELLVWSSISNDPAAILLLPAVKARELIGQKK